MTNVVDRVVVDASVALAFLRDEIGTPPARAAVATWAETSRELLVPSQFWLELTNVLVGRYAQPPSAVVEHFVDLDALGMRTIEPDRPLFLLAIDQMVRFRLSAYYAIYLALALSTGSKLATLDRRLAQAAGDVAILIGPGGVSESRVRYQTGVEDYTGWAHTAVVGAHIAELRRRALAET